MPTIPYVRATHSDGQSWSAAKANTVEAGVNDAHYMPAVRVWHNATQALVTGTQTVLAFNQERIDQAGNAADTMHDNTTNNSRLTCRYAGVYQISANITFSVNATGNRMILFRLNGATEINRVTMISHVNDNASLNLSMPYALAVNDYVEVLGYQTSGGNLNVLASAAGVPTEFAMVRLA